MNFLQLISDQILLAQMRSGGFDLQQLLVAVGVLVVIGIVVKYFNPKQYIPEPFWSILMVVLVIGFALWAMRTFF
jgi:hypothetical protein